MGQAPIKIKYAFECPLCDCCEEPWCIEHDEHYADCACIGPGNADDLGYDIIEVDGVEYAVLREGVNEDFSGM